MFRFQKQLFVPKYNHNKCLSKKQKQNEIKKAKFYASDK